MTSAPPNEQTRETTDSTSEKQRGDQGSASMHSWQGGMRSQRSHRAPFLCPVSLSHQSPHAHSTLRRAPCSVARAPRGPRAASFPLFVSATACPEARRWRCHGAVGFSAGLAYRHLVEADTSTHALATDTSASDACSVLSLVAAAAPARPAAPTPGIKSSPDSAAPRLARSHAE